MAKKVVNVKNSDVRHTVFNISADTVNFNHYTANTTSGGSSSKTGHGKPACGKPAQRGASSSGKSSGGSLIAAGVIFWIAYNVLAEADFAEIGAEAMDFTVNAAKVAICGIFIIILAALLIPDKGSKKAKHDYQKIEKPSTPALPPAKAMELLPETRQLMGIKAPMRLNGEPYSDRPKKETVGLLLPTRRGHKK